MITSSLAKKVTAAGKPRKGAATEALPIGSKASAEKVGETVAADTIYVDVENFDGNKKATAVRERTKLCGTRHWRRPYNQAEKIGPSSYPFFFVLFFLCGVQ